MVGISRDTHETLERYKQEKQIPFALVSDRKGAIHRKYDVVRRLGLGVKRVTYLIEKSGTIRAVSDHEIRIKRHVSEMLSALDAL